MNFSFGDIVTSRAWVSFERRYFDWRRWSLGFGPTYNGTTHGVVLLTPWFTVVGHVRDLRK